MKRRAFIKGMTAAGAVSLLPMGSASTLLQGCEGPKPSLRWDFDEVIDRSGTWSIKASRAGEGRYAMWIADMDFRTDPVLREALESIGTAFS